MISTAPLHSSMVDLPFVCDRDKGAKKSLTAPPPAVRTHLLASIPP